MRLLPSPGALLALLGFLGATHTAVAFVYHDKGVAAAEARQAAAEAALRTELFNMADRWSRDAARILALQQQLDQVAQELEDAAHADPDADRMSLPADSVRRVFSR